MQACIERVKACVFLFVFLLGGGRGSGGSGSYHLGVLEGGTSGNGVNSDDVSSDRVTVVYNDLFSVCRCCQQPRWWPNTPQRSAMPVAWPPPKPPTPLPSDTLCRAPRTWPTVPLPLLRPSRLDGFCLPCSPPPPPPSFPRPSLS